MPEASTVRRMFEGVAPRYDILNHVLSLGIDRSWRRKVVQSLGVSAGQRVVDLCCGTGDLALEIGRLTRCIACDFTWNMLTRARAKSIATGIAVPVTAADTLSLPFQDDVFDAATVAFGVRNLADMNAGLTEIHRILKPGGALAILEFSHPVGLLRRPYQFYLNVLLPRLGNLLSKRGEAYRYLAESIAGFPDPETLMDMMRDAGFKAPAYQRLTGGIVAIHRATK